MAELHRRISRRDLLNTWGLTILGLTAGAAVGCGAEKSSPPPEGFSRNPDDYKFKIIIDRGNAMNVTLFSNNEPVLTANGGQNFLVANDVYCPNLTKWEKENFGCKEFVQGEYRLSQPKRIIVVPNKPSDSR